MSTTFEFPRIFGHRGAPRLAPENTMASFVKAMEAGARRIEFDVNIMGDGTLVVIHDETLDRTTDGSGGFFTLGYADLRKLDAGRWFSDAYRLERVPELSDVLAFLDTHHMEGNLEIKACSGGDKLRNELVMRIARSVADMSDPSSILVSSFDHDLLDDFHGALLNIASAQEAPATSSPTSFNETNMAANKSPFGIGRAWLFDSEIEKSLSDAIKNAHEQGYVAIHPGDLDITGPEIVEQAHHAELAVNVWTVNDFDRARQLASWGVDAIFTDRVEDFPADALAR